jgi:hypothetical protein
MAQPSYYVQTPDGKKVPFDVPEGADAEQVRTLAARALKQAAPDTEYQRPVLSRDTAASLGIDYKLEPDKVAPTPPDLSKQGSISNYEPSLAERMADKIGGALSGLGVNDRYARHVGERTSGALADLTPVGAATEADLAKTAFGQGNYLGAIGHGLGSAISAIPEGGAAKAMFLGVLAKNADKVALRRAEEMVAAGADRKQIWNETGWFQGADKKWRFEVPDNEMTFKPYLLEDNRRFQGDTGLPLNEVIDHPGLEAGGYNTSPIRVHSDVADNGSRGSWNDATGKLTLDTDFTPESIKSTAAHELQHFVQGREGFARGGMTGTINSMAMREVEQTNARLGELARSMDDPDFKRNKPLMDALRKEYDDLMQHKLTNLVPRAQLDPYEGYRRLAGEVEARNVQTRLDMTPGQRKEYAPWETEDVPREDQFVIWGGDQPQGALSRPLRAYHGTRSAFDDFDPQAIAGGNANGRGFYFTTDPEAASRYATGENVNRITLEGNAGPNVRPVDLHFSNPFKGDAPADRATMDKMAQAAGWKKGEIFEHFDSPAKLRDVLQYLTYNADEQADILRKAGFDARLGGYGENDIMVFDPTQIRSPFGGQ